MTTAPTTFADLTTLRVGGSFAQLHDAETESDFIDAIQAADSAGKPLLVLGDGSNVVAMDEHFDGVVIRDKRATLTVASQDSCGGANVTVSAGHNWDDFVAAAVDNEWAGVEALSGIPGTVGAAPVQNIGAYGQEVATSIAKVRTWDRQTARVRTFYSVDLRFSYRNSILKRSMRADADDWRPGPTPRYVVLDVEFQMRLGTRGPGIAYAELARTLGVALGEQTSTRAVREAVLSLRAGKGMVLNPADHDTWSAGSFFTNPIIAITDHDSLPEGAPRYPVHTATPAFTTGPSLGAVDASRVKTSAAWLIQHAGLEKGFALPGSKAALSTKHVLALTNRGGATASEVMELAAHVQGQVRERFGIELEPEPVVMRDFLPA